MLSCFSHVQLFATLWTIALQAPLSMELSRQEYWSGWPSRPPGFLPNPGIKPVSHVSPALQADSLLAEPPEKFITIHHSGFYLSEVHNLLDVVLNALYKVSPGGLFSPTGPGHWSLGVESWPVTSGGLTLLELAMDNTGQRGGGGGLLRGAGRGRRQDSFPRGGDV